MGFAPVRFAFPLWLRLVPLFFVTTTLLLAQEDIASAKARPPGSVISIEGVSTSGSALGSIRFLQDSTGGIAVFPGNGSAQGFESAVSTGTRVQITGVLSVYHGLAEINPVLNYAIISGNNPLPVPVNTSLDTLGGSLQSSLVHIPCLTLRDGQPAFGEGINVLRAADGKTGVLYLQGGHPLVGYTPPQPFAVTAIASYFDTPQLLPRDTDDISASHCFHLTYGPLQSNQATDGFDLAWGTSDSASAVIRIGTSAESMEWLAYDAQADEFMVSVDGLEAATFYYVQCGGVSLSTGDTALTDARILTTAAQNGTMDIYFNHNVDDAYSNGTVPAGTSYAELLNALMEMIASAHTSIDVAMYNSNRDDIIDALEDVQNKGVRVRYIADGGQSNGALSPLPDFPVYFRQGDGIMHNKFVVVDPDDPVNAQVWTGSTNFSTGQLALDPNNSLHIRDQALTRAFLHEFEEMWGGKGDTPNINNSRTGSEKWDDTPHQFSIGGIPVEAYFSPSDGTNGHIITALETGDETVDMALLLVTRYDIASTLTAAASEGVVVRGIINDLESSEIVYNQLLQGGVDLRIHESSSIFHHKYAVIDDSSPLSDPTVITGSHNWTTSATTRNDENTLIIHDADIANLYRQEFEARWSELTTAVYTFEQEDLRIYPNPFTNALWLPRTVPMTRLTLTTMTGQEVFRSYLNEPSGPFDMTGLLPGAYILEVQFGDGSFFSTVVVKSM